MNVSVKNLLKTVGYYAIAALLYFILGKIAPGGHCTPGLNFIFIFFLAPLITLGLLIRNLILVLNHKKEYLYSFLLHLLVAIIYIAVYIHSITR
jgi:hypothetical protein